MQSQGSWKILSFFLLPNLEAFLIRDNDRVSKTRDENPGTWLGFHLLVSVGSRRGFRPPKYLTSVAHRLLPVMNVTEQLFRCGSPHDSAKNFYL